MQHHPWRAASLLLLVLCAVAPSSVDAWSIRGAPALRASDPPIALAKSASKSQGPLDSCGALKSFQNAEPKDPKNMMKTKFDAKTKKQVAVTFKKGDVIDFKCKPGFTTDGSKDGNTTFKVTCTNTGFFKPGGVCMKASKCGKVPAIPHATATGAPVANLPTAVQLRCNPGYSLDGKKVVAGGHGKNTLFSLKCQEFSGQYEKFTGECKAYAFVPGKKSTAVYTSVFKTLFIVTCKGKITDAFGEGKAPPVDAACGKLKAASATGACGKLVADIKKDFEARKKDIAKFEEKKEWFDNKGKPTIGKDAMSFCTDLWKLVEKPNDP